MRFSSTVVLVLATGCLPGVDDFMVADSGAEADVVVDASPPDVGRDAGASDAGSDVLDAGAADAGTDAESGDAGRFVPTAIDRECGIVWTELSSAAGDCAGRQVTTVATPISSWDLALGRESDGTLRVFYNDLEFFDLGRISSVRFDEDAPGAAVAGPSIEPLAAIGEVVGTRLAVATESPDRHHLVYWLRSDFGSEVRLRTLSGSAFSPVQTLASGVSNSGAVAVAVDSLGRLTVGWHDDGSGVNAARRQGPDESFAAAVTLRADSEPRLEGVGAIAFAAGMSGAMHAAYQWSVTLAASAPSYSVGSTTWSAPTTLDNRTIANRASGVGIDVTLVGDEVVAGYLDWEEGEGEVRFARFEGADSPPAIEVRLAGIQVAERPGRHPLVLRADAEGFLQLLTATASSVPRTLLQYHRQTRVGGELRWLVDTIASIDAMPEEVIVDMKLGEDRRPHIVFWDPVAGAIRYATIRP